MKEMGLAPNVVEVCYQSKAFSKSCFGGFCFHHQTPMRERLFHWLCVYLYILMPNRNFQNCIWDNLYDTNQPYLICGITFFNFWDKWVFSFFFFLFFLIFFLFFHFDFIFLLNIHFLVHKCMIHDLINSLFLYSI